MLACAARAFHERAQTRTFVTRKSYKSIGKQETHCIFEETLNIINPKHMPFLFFWGRGRDTKRKEGETFCSIITNAIQKRILGRAITSLSSSLLEQQQHTLRALFLWREEEEEHTTTRPVHYYYYTLLCVFSITHARTQREEEEEVFLKEILYLSRHHHVRRGFRWG